jgi:ketosteroid isomerase-like protein
VIPITFQRETPHDRALEYMIVRGTTFLGLKMNDSATDGGTVAVGDGEVVVRGSGHGSSRILTGACACFLLPLYLIKPTASQLIENDGGDVQMAAIEDFDTVVEQYQLAQGEFTKGNAEPGMKLWSHREDVTHANPFGPVVRGWEQVAAARKGGAAALRDGEMVGVEIVAKYVTPDLGYIVAVERGQAKVGGREEISPFALRVTMILRPEDGVWKIVHRHADAITTARPAESILQK